MPIRLSALRRYRRLFFVFLSAFLILLGGIVVAQENDTKTTSPEDTASKMEKPQDEKSQENKNKDDTSYPPEPEPAIDLTNGKSTDKDPAEKLVEEESEEAGKKKKGSKKEKVEKKAVKKKEKTFRPDFRDQEIQDILKTFAAIIGKNIIADEKVKGKITVISPYKIPQSLAYPYLYSMLSVKGFGIVEETPTLIRVVVLKDAMAGGNVIQLGREPFKSTDIKPDQVVTQIIPLVATKPSRLSGILKRLTSANTDLIEYDDLSILILTGSQLEVNRLIRIVNMLDYRQAPCDESESEDCNTDTQEQIGNVHIYRLENMQADNVEATLKKISVPVEPLTTPSTPGQPPAPAPAPSTPVPKKNLEIVAHKESNSLIFIGTRDEYELVKGLIRRIDLQREQVLLEVLIVEVAADDLNSFGIDWRVSKGGNGQFNTGLATESGMISTKGDVTGVNTLLGFSLGVIDSAQQNIAAILNANMKRDNFAIISAPQVLTLDNQEAEITVGEDVPVITNTRISEQNNVFNSFEYRPVGVKLKFTPQINKNRMVTLNLYQEVKAIAGSTQDSNSNPRFTKRDLKTVVRVQDAQTIVIGGLVNTDRTSNVRKIPLLGDIPIIGYLFKRTSTSMKRTNLLVFITPHVLTNRAIADKVTDDQMKSQINQFKRRLDNN